MRQQKDQTPPKEKPQEATDTTYSAEDSVADALNEQGFLLQHKVGQLLASAPKKYNHLWRVDATEVPVSLPQGKETRIDLVLKNPLPQGIPWRLLVECKRASRDYKQWIFFGGVRQGMGPDPKKYYIESAELIGSWDHNGEPPLQHTVEAMLAHFEYPAFEFGVEARLNRAKQGKKEKASATTAIEEAFQQVTLGQAGLSLRLKAGRVTNFNFLPVIVSTAQLVVADIDSQAIDLTNGKILSSEVNLKSANWVAVNYRMNEAACKQSGITFNPHNNLAADLLIRQVRTVFVVQAEHFERFLSWVQYIIVDEF